MSVDQSEFSIKDESHHSIKNESDIYFDTPLLSSVKEEITLHHDNGDSDHLFPIDKNINNTVQKPEIYTEENCEIKTKIDVINNLETDSCFFKKEPEDLHNSFQPYGTVQRKASDNLRLEIEYNDKTIVIKKETIGDTVFESEIVIEKSGIQSILNKEKCNTDHDSKFADLPRTIYKDLVNCNNKTYQNTSKREKHIYICDLCDLSFTSKQLLIFHMRHHFPNNDYCTNNNSKRVCSKNIKCKKLKIRKKKKIFSCPICCKQFNDQSNCRRHTINHANTNKFKCRFCLKQLTTQYNLRVHIRLHTGESPYKCDICNLTFQRNDNLSKHRKIHEVNQKTYDCKDCHKQFLYNNTLLRHVRIHQMENIYSCYHCQQSYVRKDSLIVHLRSRHTGEKLYQCHICKKDFFENNVLVRHMRIHKKGECRMGFKNIIVAALITAIIFGIITDVCGKRGRGRSRSKSRVQIGLPITGKYRDPESDQYYNHNDGAKIVMASHFDYEYVLGHKIVFVCVARGNPRPQITWYKDGTELYYHYNHHVHEWNIAEDSIKSKLEIDPGTQMDAGVYECSADNKYSIDRRSFKTDFSIAFES
ncbi:zinc finger protein 569 isoform X2 [Acyrthosiphon pisum]|nr:zinc finger protein 569 isoform X2 [Acyrthosiphon pisum]XP_016660444.1 zinc finger protein 569 isoform X2 [Acyrthosiphon pisum]XP_029346686.1 zinc finger protein 569 isoform X2 [Acyrthosiphon pisum]|eukprot:XP_008183778.1 PREDICTED: zinc finger protein 569 isoform X2 [Acyrthosiphon pisum]